MNSERASRHRRRWPWISAAVAVVALLGVGGWLTLRVLDARTELEASQAAITQVRGGGSAIEGLQQVAVHSAKAKAAADDPVWRWVEPVPFVGENLRAVRLAAESLDLLSGQLAVPVLEAFDGSQAGGFSLEPLIGPVQASTGRISAIAVQVEDVRRSTRLVPQVRAGIDQVASVLGVANEVATVLPGMLGADGPRNYLVVGQSNAESLALGGSAASVSQIRVDKGSIKISKQSDSRDYNNLVPLDFKLPKETEYLFGTVMRRNINATVSRPDWPTAAQLVKGMWHRDIDKAAIDGVLSVDPIALSYMLSATGPVKLSTGETVTSDNVVRLTLSEVYARYAGVENQGDVYLKLVAAAVFDRVSRGGFDPGKMVVAMSRGIDRGSLLFWSADERIQQRLADLPIGGVLPADNQTQTTIGVYFRDFSLGSKIDYYMKSAVQTATTCGSDGTTFTVKVRLDLDLSKAANAKLSEYVNSNMPDPTAYRTTIFIYGPPGSEVGQVTTGERTEKWRRPGLEDLGRPVASFNAITHPTESATVSVSFVLPPGGAAPGPLKVRTTPMVHATGVAITDQTCSGR